MLMYNMHCHHCINWKVFPTTCATHCTFIMIELNVILQMLCSIVQLVTSSAVTRFISLAPTFIANILFCIAMLDLFVSLQIARMCWIIATLVTGLFGTLMLCLSNLRSWSVCLKVTLMAYKKKFLMFPFKKLLLNLSFHADWFNHNICMKTTFLHVCIAGEL